MDFTLDTIVMVPPLFHRYEKGEWTLLYDPGTHSIVRANASGVTVIEALGRHPRLADAITWIAQSCGLTFEQVSEPLLTFVIGLVNTGFLQVGEYRPKPMREDTQVRPPQSIYIQNTERCNLKCVYCYNAQERSYFIKEHKEMSTEQMKWAIDRFTDFGIRQINFCGGEPTMREDLLEVAGHAKARDRLISLVTNGRMDTDEFTTAAATLFDVIWVSFDSHKKELMELHRGKGSFEPALNSLRKLCRVPGRRAHIVVSSVVSEHNWQYVDEFRQFCTQELGVDRFRSTTYCPSCSSSEEVDWPLQPPPFLKDQSAAFPSQIEPSDFCDTNEVVIGMSKLTGRLHIAAERRDHCGAGRGELSMLSNGDIYPCQLLCKPQYLAGNIFEKSLDDIFYSSEVLKKLRDLTVDKLPGCSTCDVKYICAGGCRAIALEMQGSIAAHNSYFCGFLHRVAVDGMWRDSLIPLDEVSEFRQRYVAAKEQWLRTEASPERGEQIC